MIIVAPFFYTTPLCILLKKLSHKPLFSVLLLFLYLFCALGVAQAADPIILGTQNNISAVKRFPAEQLEIFSNPRVSKRISARSALILHEQSGRVLFAKNPDAPRQPASTIKILTGMIAMRSLAGNEQVPVSREAAGRPSSKMYLDPQKLYRAEELINAVLLASANDASVALAEMLAGSESRFAEIMTLQAEIWGATTTNCKNATGLTAKGQTSSARDLAILFQEAMSNSDFAATMKKRSMKTEAGNTLYNHNKALWQINGTQGGKTGYTYAARQTYVGKFKRGSDSIIISIMGSETMWQDLKYLVRYGFGQNCYLPAQHQATPDQPEVELVAQHSHPAF